MVLKKLSQTKNPNPKSKNAYHIGGIKVEFPYQPYGTQLAFMGRVISTLDRAQRDGHCHALLESPTGTGKSLSLLCSTLAWQQNCKLKNQLANFAPSKPNPEAVTDPLNHGGGFIPETQSTGILPSGNQGPDQSAPDNKSSSKKKAAPTIFYASRTHSQISQAIGEYRKTSYRLPMAVLASRKNYCINENISGKENIDEQCKLSLRDESFGCTYFKNVHKLKSHPSLLKGGCHEVHDIEDLVKIGQVVKGCPYYAARSMADHAQLVFCPYSYIVNPVIRGAMELDIKEAIIILDEAHNIEDIARDAGSFDVEEDVLHKVQVELGQLCSVDTIVYQPLYEMTQDLLAWIGRRKDALEKCEFQHHFSSWTGDKALQELQEAGITRQCFPILLECATKAIKAATDPESEVAHLSGMSVLILEGLFSSLTYFFSRNGCHSDYQFVLQRHVIRHKKVMLSQKAVGDWTYTLSLWCLNPAVVFRDIAELSLSIILTSGTLSPMNTFTSELGVQFGTCFEAPHVINIESQVRAAVVSTGVDNYTLNASYKTADAYAFQDALGNSLEEIFKIVPAGSLVFFPSYKLMDKLCSRWLETGQWSRLHAIKVPFIEPRAGSQEDFDSVLKGYYNSIRKGNKPVARKKKPKRVEIGQIEDTDSSGKCKKDGAAFLAVFRGKVSEGIDFSDDNARVVIVVGIPFPNINDIKVNLKKKYNDTYKQSKNLLSGSEWYCQQAFRALNQAIGRCIRHRFDYGAIVMLDERYREERNRVHISKWLRNSLQQYDKFDMLLESLKSFFREAKENVGKIKLQLMPKSDLRDSLNDRSNILTDGCMRNTQEKVENFGCCGQEAVTLTNWGAAPPNLKLQGNVEEHVSIQIEEDADSCKEIIDLECHSFKDLRCSEISSLEEPEISVVSETPGVNGKLTAANEESFLKNGNCISSRVQDSIEQSDLLSLHPTSLTKLRETPFESQYSTMVSPEKVFTINTCRSTAGESSLNWSATSHTQKRRKFTGSPLTTTISNQSDAFDVQTHGSFNHTKEFSFESYNAESKSIMAGSPQCASPCLTSNIVMDKRLKISCSLCKTPLGLPANNLYVVCSLSSLTKVHLAFLARERLEHPVESTSAGVPVLLTDVSSVDQCLFNSTPYEAPPGQGFWSEEDGCVFKSVFCPFCSTSNCLGVKVMATDASNISLLNKVLLFVSCLQIQNHEILKDRGQNDKVSVPCHSPVISKMAALNSIDKFSYTPPQQSGGWRSTKSKLQLPKRKMHHAG